FSSHMKMLVSNLWGSYSSSREIFPWAARNSSVEAVGVAGAGCLAKVDVVIASFGREIEVSTPINERFLGIQGELYILEGNRFVCQQDFQNATKSSTPSSTSNRPDTLHKVRIMLIREWCQRYKRLGHSAVSNPRALKRRAFTAASAGDEFTEHS
ncbi:hypothetical protein ANCDUO_15802, partial [Ancylostoma duodenale]